MEEVHASAAVPVTVLFKAPRCDAAASPNSGLKSGPDQNEEWGKASGNTRWTSACAAFVVTVAMCAGGCRPPPSAATPSIVPLLSIKDLYSPRIKTTFTYGAFAWEDKPGSLVRLDVSMFFFTDKVARCELSADVRVTANGVALPPGDWSPNVQEAGGIVGCIGGWYLGPKIDYVDSTMESILKGHSEAVDDELLISDATGRIRMTGPKLFARRGYTLATRDPGILHRGEHARLLWDSATDTLAGPVLGFVSTSGAWVIMDVTDDNYVGVVPFAVPDSAPIGVGLFSIRVDFTPISITKCDGARSCEALFDTGPWIPRPFEVRP